MNTYQCGTAGDIGVVLTFQSGTVDMRGGTVTVLVTPPTPKKVLTGLVINATDGLSATFTTTAALEFATGGNYLAELRCVFADGRTYTSAPVALVFDLVLS